MLATLAVRLQTIPDACSYGIRHVPGSAFNGLSVPSWLPRKTPQGLPCLFTVWRLHGSSTQNEAEREGSLLTC